MRLSELAQYRELLEELTPCDQDNYLKASLEPAIHAVKENHTVADDLRQDLLTRFDQVRDSLAQFSHSFDQIKRQIHDVIESHEPAYFSNSYHCYENEFGPDTLENVRNQRLVLDPGKMAFMDARIKTHGDWKFAGMIMRPGFENFINSMVALDPLYVVDMDHALFDPVKKQFNSQYLDRLRFCAIQEDSDHPMLDRIPDNQLGFVLAYNFFHRKPFEIMRAYLTEISHKLRSGGVIAFTFNDCDRWGAVINAERGFMCYTPGRMVRSLLESQGFEITMYHVIDNATTWIEARKPGDLASLRGGQSLARVLDKHAKAVYTDEEAKKIIQQAIDLNINTPE
jgi:hypothetical protein